MSKILLLEDDLSLINGLSFAFKKQGFELVVARTLKEADSLWMDGKYDLLVLDVSLPDGTGFEFCKWVRQVSKVPIIFLTASDEETSIIMGLDMGGDDYITKPFSLAVLRARVNAQLRRSAPVKPDRIELNGFIFDFAQLEFSKDSTIIDLSKTEQRLLRLLVENRGRTLPRELLLEKVWDGGEFVDENALSVAVRRLRIKLGDAPIKTVYGVGYTWEAGR